MTTNPIKITKTNKNELIPSVQWGFAECCMGVTEWCGGAGAQLGLPEE